MCEMPRVCVYMCMCICVSGGGGKGLEWGKERKGQAGEGWQASGEGSLAGTGKVRVERKASWRTWVPCLGSLDSSTWKFVAKF